MLGENRYYCLLPSWAAYLHHQSRRCIPISWWICTVHFLQMFIITFQANSILLMKHCHWWVTFHSHVELRNEFNVHLDLYCTVNAGFQIKSTSAILWPQMYAYIYLIIYLFILTSIYIILLYNVYIYIHTVYITPLWNHGFFRAVLFWAEQIRQAQLLEALERWIAASTGGTKIAEIYDGCSFPLNLIFYQYVARIYPSKPIKYNFFNMWDV